MATIWHCTSIHRSTIVLYQKTGHQTRDYRPRTGSKWVTVPVRRSAKRRKFYHRGRLSSRSQTTMMIGRHNIRCGVGIIFVIPIGSRWINNILIIIIHHRNNKHHHRIIQRIVSRLVITIHSQHAVLKVCVLCVSLSRTGRVLYRKSIIFKWFWEKAKVVNRIWMAFFPLAFPIRLSIICYQTWKAGARSWKQ